MNVSEAIETIGQVRLAELAGCARTTIDRTKQRGAFSSGQTGARIRQAIRDQGLALDGDAQTGGEQSIISQIKDAELRQKMAAAAEKERHNAEAEGRLVPANEVAAAVGNAGAQLRIGLDAARRSLEAILCDSCREAALERLEADHSLTVGAVTTAWERG